MTYFYYCYSGDSMAVLHAVQQYHSSGLKITGAPGLSSRPFRCFLLTAVISVSSPQECMQRKTTRMYLPVRGGSVNVRTKRREKRTKLLLSAFGNIYPPFIVTPLSRNLKHIPRICAAAAAAALSGVITLTVYNSLYPFLCTQRCIYKRKISHMKHTRTAQRHKLWLISSSS